MRRALLAPLAVAVGVRCINPRLNIFEAPLDKQAGDTTSKGPPVAHPLPVYKTAGKLNQSARWKSANLITNVVGGKDYRLRETHGEGRVDETGVYRDWLYGEERRMANYVGFALFFTSCSLFYYTVTTMTAETWDIPAPLLAKPPEVAGKPQDLPLPKPSVATKGNSTVVA